MSKFKIKSTCDTRRHYLTMDGSFMFYINPADFPDLMAAAQAALAEQNSGVMGEGPGPRCTCTIKDSKICKGPFNGAPGADNFCRNLVTPEMNCGHSRDCHQPQAQRREV